jgi:hypothetical protein
VRNLEIHIGISRGRSEGARPDRLIDALISLREVAAYLRGHPRTRKQLAELVLRVRNLDSLRECDYAEVAAVLQLLAAPIQR